MQGSGIYMTGAMALRNCKKMNLEIIIEIRKVIVFRREGMFASLRF
jgi:hypothetical protein